MENKCYICGIIKPPTATCGLDTPGLVFNWLEGTPFVCERCCAKTFGIKSKWSKLIRPYLREKSKRSKNNGK